VRQGFDHGMTTAIEEGVSTWHDGALLNVNSKWRPYGISPRCCFLSENRTARRNMFLWIVSKKEFICISCVVNDAIFEGACANPRDAVFMRHVYL
jgi:hypothetical protein